MKSKLTKVIGLFKYLKVSIVMLSLGISSLTFAQLDNQPDGALYEAELLEIISSIQVGELEIALDLTEQHLQTYPKSRVGYLIKADLLSSKYSGLSEIGAQASSKSDVLQGLTHQLKNRWRHEALLKPAISEMLPSSLIDMGKHEHVLVADMTNGRLYLYQNSNNGPTLVKDYYMSVGSEGYGKQVEGDNKTPIGVYSIYQYIDPNRLPDLYGAGAFPVDYPNTIDRYRNRTGYGIWLHGTPSDTYARAPWASEGCFVLSNADFNDIARFIDVDERTPVVLSDSINWVSHQSLVDEGAQYIKLINTWKDDWQSLDTISYLSHYSKDTFNLAGGNYQQFARQKRAVNKSKEFIKVDLEIDSLFVYPGEKDMFVVTFMQRYISNNYESETRKQQYWQKQQDGEWRIIYEG